MAHSRPNNNRFGITVAPSPEPFVFHTDSTLQAEFVTLVRTAVSGILLPIIGDYWFVEDLARDKDLPTVLDTAESLRRQVLQAGHQPQQLRLPVWTTRREGDNLVLKEQFEPGWSPYIIMDSQTECTICNDPIKPVYGGIRLSCPDHCAVCRDCLTALFERAARFEVDHPPRLHTTLHVAQFKQWLPRNLLVQYGWKKKEYTTPGLERVYCSNTRCNLFHGKKDAVWASNPPGVDFCVLPGPNDFGLPVACLAGTCLSCKQVLIDEKDRERHHLEECTASESYEMKPYKLDNRWKHCPGCGTAIHLAEACNHITCQVCRHQWCFVCLQDRRLIKGHHPECPLYGDPAYEN